MKILVVDDEPQICKQIQIGFAPHGYTTITASDGETAIASTVQNAPDVIILDISLGSDPDGLEVCRRLREWTNTPIIILSVHSAEVTKVLALQIGADDYLTKPFGMDELHARIVAVQRRFMAEPGMSTISEIRAGALRIDLVHRLVFVENEEVHLTPKEYELLRLLATNQGKVITHRTILSTVWGPKQGEEHYVRVFVNQIRKKLRENPTRNIRYILNESGVGYRFVTKG